MTIYFCCVCLPLPEPRAPHAISVTTTRKALSIQRAGVICSGNYYHIFCFFITFFLSFNSCALERFCCHFGYVPFACSTHKTLAMFDCLALVCERGGFEKCILSVSLAAGVVFLFSLSLQCCFVLTFRHGCVTTFVSMKNERIGSPLEWHVCSCVVSVVFFFSFF